MTRTMTFGQCLAQWMQERGLSVAALARMTGAKSATTVSRLIHDQTSPQRCAAFMETLLTVFPDMSEAEKALLQRGLSVSRIGTADSRAEQALTDLLFDRLAEPSPSRLSELLLSHTDADRYDLFCMQCVDRPILEAFDLLLRASDQRVHIYHFLVGPLSKGTASFTADARRILCDTRYELTYRHAEHIDSTWLPGNLLILRTQRNQTEQQLLILPKPHGEYAFLPLDPATDLYSFLLHSAQEASLDTFSVTRTYLLNTPRSCLEYLSHCYDMEKGRACCLLRAKPNLAMVPVELLQELYNDAVELQQTSVKDYTLELRRICFLRYANRWEDKHPTRVIFSRTQLQEFMENGLLIDHFSSLRPFRPEERRQILAHIIRMAEELPNMHLHIARDERLFSAYRFSCYEGSGLLLSPAAPPSTGAGERRPYTEVVLVDSVCVRQFRDLFCNVLIPQYAYSREESVAIMRDILAASQNA